MGAQGGVGQGDGRQPDASLIMEDTGIVCEACKEPATWEMDVGGSSLSVICGKCGNEAKVPNLSDEAMFRFYMCHTIYGVGKVVKDG